MQSRKKEAHIWYLFHSGFAVKTSRHFLIFDYYLDKPDGVHTSLDAGVINPNDINGLDVIAFSSHEHHDHFNPVILSWSEKVKNIKYMLSYDIKPLQGMENVLMAYPGHKYSLDGLQIEVFDSTDIGVSFLVSCDGYTIFHAGDLNWWHWEGEPEEENALMAKNYRKQIDLLQGRDIDFAFIPVDPRLEEHFLLGLDYFMRTVGAQKVFPMHFGDDYSIFSQLNKDARSAKYIGKVECITHRGQHFVV